MSNHQDENNHAGAQSRAEGANLTDVLGALLPCPFCGKLNTLEVITGAELMDENQEYWQHSASYGVVCNAATPNGKGGCGAIGGFSHTKSAAIEKWNMRSPNIEVSGGAKRSPA